MAGEMKASDAHDYLVKYRQITGKEPNFLLQPGGGNNSPIKCAINPFPYLSGMPLASRWGIQVGKH